MSAGVCLSGVTFTYAGRPTASIIEVDLSIAPGEFIVLTGRSGCGKSTVVKAICGLIPHSSPGSLTGTVQVGGLAVATAHSSDLARRVGVVFQDPRSQFFTTTVDDEIAFACENLGVPGEEIERRVQEAARLAGVEDLRGRAIFGLSSGQKQLVALASVLATGPDVILLDEPSANLDPRSTARLGEVLERLHALGRTIVVAEHRLGYLLGRADRLVRMEAGRIAQQWTTAEARALTTEELRVLGLRSTSEPAVERVADRAPACSDETPDQVARRLEIREVTVRAGRAIVQQDLSLAVSVPRGAVVALTGPIGSGKTTVARAIAGLHRPTSGRIAVDGEVLSPRRRVRAAFFVMQDTDYQLFSDSVANEIELAAPGLSPDRAEEILDRLGLAALTAEHPLSLSGGQKQRLAIAAAVASGARILVFDEPTSGLDADSMRRVAGILRSLSDAGVLVLVTTHDEELLAELPALRIELAPPAISV